MPEQERIKRKKLAVVMFLLAGILCLAGMGIYFFGRSQTEPIPEYDGVLVWEKTI